MTRTSPIPVGVALGTIGLEGDAWLRAAALLATAPIDRLWIWDHLKGRGAPNVRRPSQRGDLLIHIVIEVPKKLSGDQRKALEAYAKASGEDQH